MHTYFLLHADVRVSVVLVRHFKSLVIVVWVVLISAPEIAFSNGHSRTWDHQFILNWYHQWEFYRDGHQRDNSRVNYAKSKCLRELNRPLFESQKGGHFSANTMCQLFLDI